MKKLLLTLTTCTGLLTAQAQGERVYQIPNSDFENWAADKEPGNGWNSFASAGGSLGSFASMSPAPEKAEGYQSNTAVKLTSKNLWIANANGNLTTGRISMGNMTPANADNYNYTDLDSVTHHLLFAGTPDSVACYAKFVSGGSENGRGQFILHDEYRYCDPETSNEAGYESHKVALAAILIKPTTEWTYCSAPFEYTGVAKPEKQYMLASFTTNPVPGGSANDTLIVDDVKLIYYSELASLAYDGTDIFVEGQTVYNLSDETYDADKLACTSNGRAATIETSFNEITSMLTITVKGDDWSEDNLNQHVYTVQFAKKALYQIPNSDFENWADDKEPGNGWNSFASAGGSWASFASMSPAPEKTEGYQSNTAVKLTSKNLWIANANGNLTTGRISMGSTTPANAANYNYTDLEDGAHNWLFAGTPDAVSCYAKFKSGGSENGRGQFILHDKYGYRDPETSNEEGYESHKVALAAILIPECEEWTYFEAPFEYTGVAKPEKQYMLASFTTNPVPGGSANDTLIVDDVKLIYYSELASLAYDGTDIFVEGQTAYDLSDKAYDETKLACTSNGRAAIIEKSYDEATGVLTLTVKGDDWSEDNLNQHVYTVQFQKIVNYTNELLVIMNGEPLSAPQETTIQLAGSENGAYSFILKNFSINMEGTTIGVGTIQLNELSIENGQIHTTQTIQIAAGEDTPPGGTWIGPVLGDVPVELQANVSEDNATAQISIAMLGQIDVTFAPELTLNAETSIAEDVEGLHIVNFSRTFAAGWNTVCLPFATSVSSLEGATQAQAFTDYSGNVLNFKKVANDTLEANTPYLIYFEKETEVPATYAAAENFEAQTVAHGEVSFTGNYTAGKNMEGLYGVADQNGSQYIMMGSANSTLGSTSAYFTVAGAQTNAMRIQLEGGATAIDKVTTDGETFDVYTLGGVKVRENATGLNGLQKGIYIVNGKKVVVK